MNRYLRLFLLVALLILTSLALVACEKERPAATPVQTTLAPASRGTVAPSPTPPVVLTQVTLPGTTGTQAGQATPAPAGAATPTAPAPQSVEVNPAAGQGATGDTSIYVVQAGDTLAAIARRFGTTIAELVRLNSLADPDRIAIGQKLVVPGAGSAAPAQGTTTEGERQTYVVQAGDSLLSIARRFGVTTKDLQAANNLSNPDLIYPGQVLVIP